MVRWPHILQMRIASHRMVWFHTCKEEELGLEWIPVIEATLETWSRLGCLSAERSGKKKHVDPIFELWSYMRVKRF